nr:hypothetical protein [Tanacetum cinerariifolium]
MGYEHPSITPETESDEVTKSNAENLLPIPSKCEVTLEDEIECDMPAKDVCSPVFTTISNPLFKDNDDLDFSDDEMVSQQEEIDIVTSSDDVLPPSDENDDDYDFLLEEVDLFLFDNSIPPGIENVADDPEGDDSPLIPRPPPEPPDDNFDLEPEVISAVIEDIDEPDEHFNPGGEINVSTMIEDDDYFPFMFVIRIFLPYLILPEISPLFLSAESEDTIFDPGLFPEIEVILCRIYVWFPRSSYPLIDFSLGRSISF